MMFSLPLLLKNRPRQDGLPQGSAEALPAPVADPLARFRTTKEHAITLGDALLSVLTDNLRQGDPALLDEIWRLLPFYIDVVATADFATAAATDVSPPSREEAVPTIPEYLTTSIFLSTCLSYLLASTQQGKERINLVTGAKKGGSLRTLDRLGKVALAQQSLVGASADRLDLLRCLRELDSFGLHLHGVFHCHPGNGPAMTRPSSTDLKTQERFERGGYPCIGGICSRDGWFRLFAHRPFTIIVYGKGVVQHEDHLFHIQKYPARLSQQAPETEGGRETSHDGTGRGAWV
jgi:hypothetical protein